MFFNNTKKEDYKNKRIDKYIWSGNDVKDNYKMNRLINVWLTLNNRGILIQNFFRKWVKI